MPPLRPNGTAAAPGSVTKRQRLTRDFVTDMTAYGTILQCGNIVCNTWPCNDAVIPRRPNQQLELVDTNGNASTGVVEILVLDLVHDLGIEMCSIQKCAL
jgi:hypothetical protein